MIPRRQCARAAPLSSDIQSPSRRTSANNTATRSQVGAKSVSGEKRPRRECEQGGCCKSRHFSRMSPNYGSQSETSGGGGVAQVLGAGRAEKCGSLGRRTEDISACPPLPRRAALSHELPNYAAGVGGARCLPPLGPAAHSDKLGARPDGRASGAHIGVAPWLQVRWKTRPVRLETHNLRGGPYGATAAAAGYQTIGRVAPYPRCSASRASEGTQPRAAKEVAAL